MSQQRELPESMGIILREQWKDLNFNVFVDCPGLGDCPCRRVEQNYPKSYAQTHHMYRKQVCNLRENFKLIKTLQILSLTDVQIGAFECPLVSLTSFQRNNVSVHVILLKYSVLHFSI